MTINSNGGGFYSLTGNLNISNSTIKINNSAGKGNEGGICIGSSLDEYGGKVDIKNSLIEIKTKNSGEELYVLVVSENSRYNISYNIKNRKIVVMQYQRKKHQH